MTFSQLARLTAALAAAVPAWCGAATAEVEKPVAATIKDGAPVGLYFMTRFWPATNSLEKSIWYFADDGLVYENLEVGFSSDDLARHAGRKGHGAVVGDRFEVTWFNGKKTSSKLSPSGKGFSWNAGIFTAVKPFDGKSIAGTYEGGESVSGGTGRAIVSKRLQLRADGTFTWTGVSFLSSDSQDSTVSASAAGGGSAGKWKTTSHSLILTDEKGNVFRRIAFPYDDEKTPIKPDHLFFGGLLYKRVGD